MLTTLAILVFAAPATASPAHSLSVSGEVRLRGESFNEADLDPDNEHLTLDGETLLLRTRLTFEADPSDRVTVLVQVQDARIFGFEATTAANTGNLDLHQGYVRVNQIAGESVALELGRMKLSYGDQRLLGGFEWANNARAFDAIRVRTDGLVIDRQKVDLFYARLHHDRSDGNRALGDDLVGAYKSTALGDSMTLDSYSLYLHDRGGPVDFDGDGIADGERFIGGGRMHLVTLGARFDADLAPGVHLNTEVAGQIGTRGDLDVRAFAAHLDVAYRATAAVAQPGVRAGYDVASGDRDPTDDTWGTFENLFPTNHLFYGYLDLAAWKNIHDVHGGVSLVPAAKSVLEARVHALMRISDNDTFYRASGAPLRPLPSIVGVTTRYVGTEVDLSGTFSVNPNLGLHGGFSVLLPGAFLDQTAANGSAPTPIFSYLQVSGSF